MYAKFRSNFLFFFCLFLFVIFNYLYEYFMIYASYFVRIHHDTYALSVLMVNDLRTINIRSNR